MDGCVCGKMEAGPKVICLSDSWVWGERARGQAAG